MNITQSTVADHEQTRTAIALSFFMLNNPSADQLRVSVVMGQLAIALTDEAFRVRSLEDLTVLKEVSTLLPLTILPPPIETP